FDGWTITRTADEQSIASAFAGNRVAFRNTVRNLGNAADSFSISLNGAPTGWACAAYAADGATPVSVVGPVAPLATAAFVVRCQIPSSGVTTEPSSVVVDVQSVHRSAATDSTINVVQSVASGFGVAFGGDSEVAEAAAGDTASFELSVLNQGSNADSFALT